ncbi:AI-2E family transporter [Aeromicrobium sp. CF3.5]|uniref:AI-2E family transporter n=1 Tax=Aeromicrobium sp. CF3.5 TaxID=3373078 RepID=UPI003EE7280B
MTEHDLRPKSATPASEAPAPRQAVIGSGVTWLATWTWRVLVVAVGLIVLGLAIGKAWSIVLPVVLALILTTVLHPPALWMEKRWRLPAAVASLVALVGALGIMAMVIWFIAPSISSEVTEIADSASEGLTQVEDWVSGNSNLDVTQAQVDALVNSAQDRLESSATAIASGVLVGVSAITSALITFVLTLVLSFFMLKDGRRFLPWVRSLSGPTVGVHLAEVGSRAWHTLANFVRTQALVGLIDALLIGLGLVVVGVPLALPLAVLTFFAAFAPIIGAVVVGILAVLVTLVTNGWVAALIIAGVVLAVQQLEGNVLLPWLQGRTLNLHASVVLLAIVLGSTLFGVVGAFLSVPAAAIGAVVLRYVNEEIMQRAGEVPPADLEETEDSTDETAQVAPAD